MARILVVEDDQDLSFIYKTALERENHVVTTVANVAEALITLTNADFELIILDMNMPGAPGIRVIEFARNDVRLRNVPILVVSAIDQWRAEATRLGVTRFLAKPVPMQKLLTLVNEATAE